MERSVAAGRGRTDQRACTSAYRRGRRASIRIPRNLFWGPPRTQHNTASDVCTPHKHTHSFNGRVYLWHRVFVSGHIITRLFVCTCKYYIASRSVSSPCDGARSIASLSGTYRLRRHRRISFGNTPGRRPIQRVRYVALSTWG